ncbi:MAG: cupredoxin domain-containing protein [Acidimicrobiales bacterium]
MTKAPSRREQRFQQAQARKRRQTMLAAGAVLLVGIIVVIGVLALTGGGSDVTIARVTLDDYTIAGDLEVTAGEVELVALNVGKIPHNVGIKGGAIGTDLRPGLEGSVNLGELPPGTYQLFCDISDHEDRGMVANFTVVAESG